MSDEAVRTAERTGDDLRAKMGRIRAGLEPMPTLGSFDVLDPLHLVPLRTKVEKLNKAGLKKGAIPLQLVEAPEARWVARTRPDGTPTQVRVRAVTVLGEAPNTGEWGYAALLSHSPSGTVIHRTGTDLIVAMSEFTRRLLAEKLEKK